MGSERPPATELAPETTGGIQVCEQWCDLVRADVDLAAIWKLERLPWESTGWGNCMFTVVCNGK